MHMYLLPKATFTHETTVITVITEILYLYLLFLGDEIVYYNTLSRGHHGKIFYIINRGFNSSSFISKIAFPEAFVFLHSLKVCVYLIQAHAAFSYMVDPGAT